MPRNEEMGGWGESVPSGLSQGHKATAGAQGWALTVSSDHRGAHRAAPGFGGHSEDDFRDSQHNSILVGCVLNPRSSLWTKVALSSWKITTNPEVFSYNSYSSFNLLVFSPRHLSRIDSMINLLSSLILLASAVLLINFSYSLIISLL